MIIATAIEVTADVYRYYLHQYELRGESSPEALMALVLSEYAAREEQREGQ